MFLLCHAMYLLSYLRLWLNMKELLSSKDVAATAERQFSAEISTVSWTNMHIWSFLCFCSFMVKNTCPLLVLFYSHCYWNRNQFAFKVEMKNAHVKDLLLPKILYIFLTNWKEFNHRWSWIDICFNFAAEEVRLMWLIILVCFCNVFYCSWLSLWNYIRRAQRNGPKKLEILRE